MKREHSPARTCVQCGGNLPKYSPPHRKRCTPCGVKRKNEKQRAQRRAAQAAAGVARPTHGTCAVCGEQFPIAPRGTIGKYCTPTCRAKARSLLTPAERARLAERNAARAAAARAVHAARRRREEGNWDEVISRFAAANGPHAATLFVAELAAVRAARRRLEAQA